MNRAVQEVLHSTDFTVPLILAVSGGKDSVSLLNMVMKFFQKFKSPPEIVHFNHGLREESKKEEDFIISLGKKYKVKVKIFKLNTIEFKEQNNLSIEEAARWLRYRTLFEYTKNKKNKGNIYTGHTAEDQAETLLFRILTGSGRRGLTGIRDILPLDSGWKVMRPLLDISSDEIREYVENNSIKYLTDKSNFDIAIPRNFIRHKIMPLVKRLNPSAVRNIKKLTDILKAEENFLKREVKKRFEEIKIKREDDKIYIELNSIISYNKWIIRRLLRDISPVDLDYNRINLIEELIDKEGTLRYIELGNGWKVRKIYGQLVFEKERPQFNEFFYKISPGDKVNISSTDITLKTTAVGLNDIDYSLSNTEYFDMAALDLNNIWVRTRKVADRMSLFGMEGTKKIKDLCIDLKINLRERNRLLIIGSGDKIIWTAPYRRSAQAPVSSTTERILKIIYDRG